jgi:hypothetical protein
MRPITYHAIIVKVFTAIIATKIQRKLTGIKVVLKELLRATGSEDVTHRTTFWAGSKPDQYTQRSSSAYKIIS